jgi:hypothetical protein
MGFAAMAVDVGYLQYRQHQQQSATDAAAIGGASALLSAGCPSPSNATTAAQSDASSNGYTNGSGTVTVNVSNAPASGPYSTDNCAVDVQITSPHATFFSNFFMPSSWKGKETTEAVATIAADANGCIYLLDQTQQFQLNGTNLNAASCGVLSDNNRVQINGGTITVGSFGYAGTDQLNGATFPLASPMQMLPVNDPCPNISGCAYLAANPPTTTSCRSYQLNGGSGSILPGCYSQIQVNGGTLTLGAGTYELTGQLQINGGSVSGTGVTVYAAAGGSLQSNGNPLTLIAPTTGSTAGVAYYQVPGNTNLVQYNGSNDDISGLVYAPSAQGQVNGSSGSYVVLVFGTMQLNGGLTLAGPAPGQSIIRQVVLSQ